MIMQTSLRAILIRNKPMTDIQSTRAWLVEEMRAHKAADRLAQGAYWDDDKGCPVGCAMQSLDPNVTPNDHARYAELVGAPEMLFRLEDCIFEGLPNALAMEWPVRFTIALRDSGADEEALRRACMRFLHTTVSRSLERYADAETRAACQPALDVVAASAKGQPISAEKAAAEAVRAATAEAERKAAWAAYVAVVSEASALAARAAVLAMRAAAEARAAVLAMRAAAEAVRAARALAPTPAALAEWAVSASVRAATAAEAEKARDAAKEAAYTEMADALIAEIEAAS